MSKVPDDVLAAKVALQEVLDRPSWLRGIGIGRDDQGHHIRVNIAHADAPVPETWNGVRVVTLVVGDIVKREDDF